MVVITFKTIHIYHKLRCDLPLSEKLARSKIVTVFELIRAQAYQVYGPEFSDAILEKIRGEV